MKLDLDTGDARYMIHSYTQDGVSVNGEILSRSFVILPDELIRNWSPSDFADLKEEHFSDIADLNPELVLLGTGNRHRFVDQSLIAPLITAGIGVECMDTAAACRSYAVLVAEGRKVAAAFLFDQ
jgi:uncharacterized protein